MNKIISYWKTLALSLIMFVLFLFPVNELSISPPIPIFSEIIHVAMFFFFTLFLVYDQMKIRSYVRPSVNIYIVAVILSFLFGLVIELLQNIPGSGRNAEFLDVIFDLCGSLLSVGIILLFFQLRQRYRSRD